MNRVYSYAASLHEDLSSSITVRLLPELTEKQKLILVISYVAIGIFIACMIAYECWDSGSSLSSFGQMDDPDDPDDLPLVQSPSHPVVEEDYPYSFTDLLESEAEIQRLSEELKFESSLLTMLVNPNDPSSIKAKVLELKKEDQLLRDLKEDVVSTPDELKMDETITQENRKADNPAIKDDLAKEDTAKDDFAVKGDLGKDDSSTKDDSKTDKATEKDPLSGDVYLGDEDLNYLDFIDTDLEEAGGLSQRDLRMLDLQEKLELALLTYPAILRQYAQEQFSGNTSINKLDIYEHLALLSGFMTQHAENEEFIYNCLRQVDLFLTKVFFNSKTELCLQEQQKIDLIVFHEFFAIVEKHFHILLMRDHRLAIDLKVKLANLPLRDEIVREEKFPNVHLSEQDQLTILISHFQREEDRCLKAIINKIRRKKFAKRDINKLAKMIVETKSHLTSSNRAALQEAISSHMGKSAPAKWDDVSVVKASLSKHLPYKIWNYSDDHDVDVLNLSRASKARWFFDRQNGLSEDQIQILRWYHTTAYDNINLIINSKPARIKVLHKQIFEGAWVSTQIEPDMGNSVFVFSSRIMSVDPDVFIGFEQGKVLWRGLQKDIPLAGLAASKVPNVVLVGVCKGASKSHKTTIVRNLQAIKLDDVYVTSIGQVHYMQKEVIKIIGNPNLSSKWWGKADESSLDDMWKPKPDVTQQ